MTHSERINRLSVFLLMITAAAHAQVNRDTIKIFLTGDIVREGMCKNVKAMSVVINDDEKRTFSATPVSDCVWTADPGSYNAAESHFSLRLGFARTECRKADPYQTPPRLEFACCSGPHSHTVTLAVDPTIPSSYLRRVPSRAKSIPCVEYGVLDQDSSGTIFDVQPPKEKLVLQLGLEEPDRDDPGMPINIRALEHHATGRMPTLHIKQTGLADLLAEQRAQANGSSPNLSAVAIDLDVRKLKELKFQSLDVTVK